MNKEDQCYITMDVRWIVKTCPVCRSRDATAHGWLFNEPPPADPLEDKRKAIGQVLIHDRGEDCTVRAPRSTKRERGGDVV
jgi:hypothetical protein